MVLLQARRGPGPRQAVVGFLYLNSKWKYGLHVNYTRLSALQQNSRDFFPSLSFFVVVMMAAGIIG